MMNNPCIDNILITGDFSPISAQGSRYKHLFASVDADRVSSYCLVYSARFNEYSGLSIIRVCKSNLHLVSRGMSFIQGRFCFPDRYIFRIVRYRAAVQKIFKRTLPCVTIIGCTPFTLMLLAPWIKKKYPEIPIIVDMSDPFSFNMSYIGRRIRVFIAQQIERLSFQLIDHVVVLNEGIQEKYIEFFPQFAEKFNIASMKNDTYNKRKSAVAITTLR